MVVVAEGGEAGVGGGAGCRRWDATGGGFHYVNLWRGCLGKGQRWVGELVDGWVNGWMGGWVDGWMGGWVDGWVYGWVGGWVGGWISGWVVGWMDGWVGG